MSATAKTWTRSGLETLIACIDFRGRVWIPRNEPRSVTVRGPEAILSPRAISVLGENGVSRFAEFWTYAEGWYFGKGQPLSLGSLANMEYFLAQYSDFGAEPSLFLTRRGHLLLGWEDADGEVVEVEFTPEGYILFLGVSDTELDFDLDSTSKLLALLPNSLAADAPS